MKGVTPRNVLPKTATGICTGNLIFQRARGSRQRVTVLTQHESCPEVDGVTYMPGVYKTPKARMPDRADELANVRVDNDD